MVRLVSTAALLLCLLSQAVACVNTSYSRKEEKQITCTLTELIAGQFPEHSDVFYQRELEIRSAALAKDSEDIAARNDLAVAYLKLGRFKEAEREFLRIEEESPNRYKTHSNLGVLYKKDRQYEKAAYHTRKALEIQPEGHLGLGDYYLRMLEWRARRDDEDPTVKGRNFLGLPYDDGPRTLAANPLVNRAHLMTLIKADRHFADAYLLLGDVLYAKDDLQHAARAYRMAIKLSENDPDTQEIIWNRISLVEERWQQKANSTPGFIFDRNYEFQIDREFANADAWLQRFKEVEEKLLDDGKDVDFAIIQKELDRRYPDDQPQYLEAGVYEGEVIDENGVSWASMSGFIVLGAIAVLLFGIGAFLVNRQMATS